MSRCLWKHNTRKQASPVLANCRITEISKTGTHCNEVERLWSLTAPGLSEILLQKRSQIFFSNLMAKLVSMSNFMMVTSHRTNQHALNIWEMMGHSYGTIIVWFLGNGTGLIPILLITLLPIHRWSTVPSKLIELTQKEIKWTFEDRMARKVGDARRGCSLLPQSI